MNNLREINILIIYRILFFFFIDLSGSGSSRELYPEFFKERIDDISGLPDSLLKATLPTIADNKTLVINEVSCSICLWFSSLVSLNLSLFLQAYSMEVL